MAFWILRFSFSLATNRCIGGLIKGYLFNKSCISFVLGELLKKAFGFVDFIFGKVVLVLLE